MLERNIVFMLIKVCYVGNGVSGLRWLCQVVEWGW